jgi:hypothetical protein
MSGAKSALESERPGSRSFGPMLADYFVAARSVRTRIRRLPSTPFATDPMQPGFTTLRTRSILWSVGSRGGDRTPIFDGRVMFTSTFADRSLQRLGGCALVDVEQSSADCLNGM